jgi:hypothetical protein
MCAGDAGSSSGKRRDHHQGSDEHEGDVGIKGAGKPMMMTRVMPDIDSRASTQAPPLKPLGQQHHQQHSQQPLHLTLTLTLQRLPFTAAAQGLLLGFQPLTLESEYGHWLAARTASVVSTMSFIVLLQQVACALRDVVGPGGVWAVISPLPTHILFSLPQILLLVLAYNQDYR